MKTKRFCGCIQEIRSGLRPIGQVRLLALVSIVFTLAFPVRAGIVVSLADTARLATGTLTVSTSGVHVDGAQPQDIDWSNILEADFSDVPLHIPYFSSDSAVAAPLPAGWETKSLDSTTPSGAASFANGALTISGDGVNIEQHPDHYFFAGMPWEGDGQWTAHFKQLDPPAAPNQPSNTLAVLVLRAGLNTGDHLFGVGVTGNGNQTFLYGGGSYHGQLGSFPITLRFTRYGNTLETSFLEQDNTWKVIGEDGVTNVPSKGWIGFMVNSFDSKSTGTATIDQISLTPTPAQPGIVLQGILLKTGSFLAGGEFHFETSGGAILHGKENIVLKADHVAAAVIHPVRMEQLVAPTQTGVILRNGDLVEGDLQSVGARDSGGMVVISSVTIGLHTYFSDQACAVIAGQVKPKASNYEVRLYDGSILRVASIKLVNGKLQLQEVGDLMITVDPSEVAQVRAGKARAQALIETAWKVAEPAPVAASSDNYRGDVVTWAGPAREQILVAPAGTKIEFPLLGKSRSFVAKVAMAPGSPGGAKLGFRALVNGKEVARIPAATSMDSPVLVRFPLAAPKSLVLAIDPGPAGARLLLIDPVAVSAGAPAYLGESPR